MNYKFFVFLSLSFVLIFSFASSVNAETEMTVTETPTEEEINEYAQNLINVVNDMVQNYKNLVSPSDNESLTPSNVITVNADTLNVRQSPNTQASILSRLVKGDSFTAMCYVIGENVEGSAEWWKTSDNNYVWAGGTLEQPSGINSILCESSAPDDNNVIFTSTISGVMEVGDSWNIVVTGLNPMETIYATGGKKINNIAPTDRNPYSASDLGIFFITGVHTADVIGDWQLVWTRADGTVLGTLNFAVQEKTPATGNSDATLASGYAPNIGVYHWGAYADPSGPVAGGVDFAADKGFEIIRLTLSPRSSIDYGVSSSCNSGLSLKQLALLNGFPEAFANPSIKTFLLTVYDSTTFSDCATKKYLNPSFYTAENTNAIIEEYQDFALYLYQTYKNTGKNFILLNWEGDNELYCGEAYSYATNMSFRANCDNNYANLYNSNASVNDSIIAMRQWLAARSAGISNARAMASAQGLTGVTVSSGGEFNIVRALRDNGYKSMLYDVLPKVSLDYASYSSYESINNSNPAATLLADLQTACGVIGTNNIIVGEFGYNPDQWTGGSEAAQNYTKAVAEAIVSSGVPYGIVWQLFTQPDSNFGLFEADGEANLFGALLNY